MTLLDFVIVVNIIAIAVNIIAIAVILRSFSSPP